VAYEGQAAIELEQLAAPDEPPYPALTGEVRPARLDATPLIQAMVEDILQGATAPQIAGRFHASVAELLALACEGARAESGLQRVALSGGVFQNRLLTERLVARLERAGFQVYLNRRVPPNDGGLSLGQLAVAAARISDLGF
jgi:hydrogenase maturation protein HypF